MFLNIRSPKQSFEFVKRMSLIIHTLISETLLKMITIPTLIDCSSGET